MKIDRELYERVKNITGTDYGVDYPKERYEGDGESNVIVYDNYSIESMLEDLILEIDRLEEKIEDREEDIRDNYKRIDPASQYRV